MKEPSASNSALLSAPGHNLFGILTPGVSMSVGACLLCLAGLLSLLVPTDLTVSAVFRLTLVATGFALYGHGRSIQKKEANARAGASETSQLRTLGGALVLLGAVLGVSLFAAILEVIAESPRFFPGRYFAEISMPGGPLYDPSLARFKLMEWGGSLFVVGLLPVLLSLFLQRKKRFRPAAIVTLTILAGLACWRFWQVNHMPAVPASTQVAQFWLLLLSLARAGIWIPYLTFSRRAKLAFDQ